MSHESEEGTGAVEDRFSNNSTKGVETLLGDPKRAIIRLSIPMIIAMSLQTVYNIVDALWVSGLGADALAAVGFFFPFFFIIIAIGTGIGVGASSALSRRIGARDKDGADNVAIHSLIMMMASSAVIAVVFIPLAPGLFNTLGAGPVIDDVTAYAYILFAAAPLLFFVNWATAILRGEGDVNRAMYAMAVGTVLNMFLDPIFIYTLGLGVAGAAWATAISMAVSSFPLVYWMFLKRDTFVTMRRCCFKYSTPIVKDILSVGLPATVMQLSMSITMVVLNIIIVDLGGTDGVAVFTTGWRVVMISILPLLGIATAVVSVTGAAYGARDYGKMNTAWLYAIRFGFTIEVIAAVATFLLAPQIAAVFSTGEGGDRIVGELESLIRISALQYPFVTFGMFSSSLFQGTGKGSYALAVTLLRTVVFTIAFALVLPYVLGLELTGVWWGVTLGNVFGALVAFAWARVYVAHLNGLPAVEHRPAPLLD